MRTEIERFTAVKYHCIDDRIGRQSR